MKPIFTSVCIRFTLMTIMFAFCAKSGFTQALGTYQFTELLVGTCPNLNTSVTAQPANATFSQFTNVSGRCIASVSSFYNDHWNTGSGSYNQFTITPNAGYVLNLSSLSFSHVADGSSSATWYVQSSIDNYVSTLGSGSVSTTAQTAVVNLPAASFTGVGAVTFRIYLSGAGGGLGWSNDDVTLNSSVAILPPAPANPTSNSPQCSAPGVTLIANGIPPAGITWYWQTSATGTNTANAASIYIVNTSGTYYIRAQDNTTLAWSSAAGSLAVTITPSVSTPVFTLGVISTRCKGAGTVTYTATATNSTGIIYSLDAVSLLGNNTINPATGAVTYDPAWSGTSIVTAIASGCSGPTTSNHTVTITPQAGTPVFTLGATSVRCQGAGSVTYTATATNSTGITYSLDATTAAFAGNSINTVTGVVTYAAGWSGTSTITASAAGCVVPQTAVHTVTITPPVGIPVFALGATSTRCQVAGIVNYTSTSTNTTGITYSLNAPSITAGNSINSVTGDVTYVAGYSGTTIITASAAGCSGPKTSTHTVTVTATVGTPVLTLGAASTRCQLAGIVTYTATATTATGFSYVLDATSLSGGNAINAATGAVTYASGWSGTSMISVTAAGCNGPSPVTTHTVTTTPVVATPLFTSGTSSVRCQAAGTVTYSATATNSTGITYSLDAITNAYAGNSINVSTGVVTYASGWSGTSTITATAAGCTPTTAIHTVTTTPTVGIPVFTLGATTARCQAAGVVTYTVTATNNTGITYSLDATSLAGSNTIDATTGAVTYTAAWSGTSTITATATGCNGPKSASHTVTVNGLVAVPVFSLGATSVRCQGAASVTYTATATNTTGLTYSIDAASITGSNSINALTGVVSFASAWSGTTTITASAAGCSGPKVAVHTVTITPTVSTPVFSLGTSSVRCQGAGSLTYTATATNTTGLTYSLDAASITGNNSINPLTGMVTYASTWVGTTTITASAAGCNGPKTAVYTVTTTASVGTPVFAMGAASNRLQAAGTVVYTAAATTTTGITYSLDAAGTAGGNTISATTGSVTFAAGWSGSFVITASAAGCSGPAISTHVVNTNPTSVITSLYLSDPSQALDRMDPVATNDGTTAFSSTLNNTSTTTFKQATVLTAPLTIIKSTAITVKNYVSITSGTMPANPNITAVLKSTTTNIITLTNPTYNSGTGLLTWTGTLPADLTIAAGEAISLDITSAVSGVSFKINYDSYSKPSKIDLPVSTYITIVSMGVYDAPYPNGNIKNSFLPGTSNYVRTTATSPFGAADVTGVDNTITPTGTSNAATLVGTTIFGNTYEYNWTTPAISGTFTIAATADQGFEEVLNYTSVITGNICTVCAPVAVMDSASGAGGSPVVIDVLANDYDPNNNINVSSLTILTQPTNGDALLTGGKIVYIPNGTYTGTDQFTYSICDLTSPVPLCATAAVKIKIDPTIVDPCSEATQTHVFYIPFPEQDSRTALLASQNTGVTINNIRTVISLKMPYPGTVIVWDEWEDGYESNPLNPAQTTTKVWGDGNPYNGIAPGYPNDIIPAGGSIVLDNTIPSNPRVAANIFYDGRDKVFATGQISMTQVSGEPGIIDVQCMKTDIASTNDFGTSFTVPVGQDFPSQDFAYTALFIRAKENNTVVNIDKNNDGVFETTITLNEGQSTLVNGGVKSGAKVTSSAPIGIDLHFGGIDNYSSREVPLYPASWYSSTYYTPVPTTGSSTAIKDTNAVYLYNSLNRAITINWYSGIPTSGVITIPAKSVKRFPLAVSQTAAYKFVNPTGESFTAIQLCDSYTPGGGGNSGTTYDWAFNLIAEERLTTFATTAWAPGSTDGTRNDNPIWVTPAGNTTIYVKYDGNLLSGGSVSPSGLHYDVSYPLNALNHKRLKDPNDNDQSGLAVFTCDNTKLAAVYGEDASTALGANPSWDVGSTIRPFCAMKLIFANDDYGFTLTDNPVTIPILKNDYGFSAIIDPHSVNTTGLLQPKHGTVTINPNGTILYTPNPGYQGMDTLEYSVCSTPSPIVCDIATVYVKITSCPSPSNRNIISGQVFLDVNKDGINNDGGRGVYPATVYLYIDGNCNATVNPNELADSVSVDNSGTYQFITYPEKTISDNFEGTGGASSCASGTDGNTAWLGDWTDAGDPSAGFCVTPALSLVNTKAEIVKDGAFGNALRLKGANVSATRTVNLNGATYAFLTFSYRRASATLGNNEDIIVQASTNGTSFSTVYTINGDGTTDAGYVTIWNQDISAYTTSAKTYIRFLTNANVDDADSVFIDDISIKYLKYPQCYIIKLAPSSVPTYYLTTGSQKTFSVSGSGSCYAPYDFGYATTSGVLPVVSMPLTGMSRQNENWLYWSTESEINTSYFEVQNSTDGSNFTGFGNVPAKENASSKSYYNYIHHDPSKVVNYYRIKLVDKDSRITYSNTISIKPGGEPPTQLSVMPNPFNSNLTVEVTLSLPGKAVLSIIDMYGKTVKTMNCVVFQGFNIIPVNNLEKLPAGTYILQITNQTQVGIAKILKMK